MLRLETLGEFSNGCPIPVWKPLDLKHQEVLQRGDAMTVSDLFAETEKVSSW